jgi:hypothetical protein
VEELTWRTARSAGDHLLLGRLGLLGDRDPQGSLRINMVHTSCGLDLVANARYCLSNTSSCR